MPEAIISAKGTEAPTVRSGRFTTKLPTPAGAGINRGVFLLVMWCEYLPRRRGDKPIGDGVVRGLAKPTPHMRG